MAGLLKLMCIIVLACAVLTTRVEAAQTVLFDTGHGERFLIGEEGPLQLSGFAEVLLGEGAKIGTLSEPISDHSRSTSASLACSRPRDWRNTLRRFRLRLICSELTS